MNKIRHSIVKVAFHILSLSKKHKKITFLFLVILSLIGAYVWKWNQKPTLSPEAKKTIESYKNTFPGEVKSGPSFVIEKQNLLGEPESYTIKSK